MINFHAQQSLSADGFGNVSLKYTTAGPVTHTDTIPATDYDETSDIVTALDGVSSLNWTLSTTGKVACSAVGIFTPLFYDSTSSSNAALYNNLWGLLGYDTTETHAAGIKFTAENYPSNTIWLDVINEKTQEGRQTIVQQAIGLQGGIKQIPIANLTTQGFSHLYIDDTQRIATEAWYGLAGAGALITVNDSASQIGQYKLDESMIEGSQSVLTQRTVNKYRYWTLQLRLRAA